MKDDLMHSFGWRKITSESQAWQLLRHELKHHAKMRQRHPDMKHSFNRLLDFRVGNWFKFLKNRHNRHCSIIVQRSREGQR